MCTIKRNPKQVQAGCQQMPSPHQMACCIQARSLVKCLLLQRALVVIACAAHALKDSTGWKTWLLLSFTD